MQHGFMAVVVQLINERPGLPAEEYARIALERGLCDSDAKDRVFSLGTTLAKEVREGRMADQIRRERVNGKFCYFPAQHPFESETQVGNGLRVEVEIPPDAARRVTDLLEIDEFGSPSEAVVWLLQAGIKAKQSALNEIANEIQEIRQRKESARRLL